MKSDDRSHLSRLDRFSWLVPVPVLYLCDLFLGEIALLVGSVRCWPSRGVTRGRGQAGGPQPEGPQRGVPSRGLSSPRRAQQLCSLLWQSKQFGLSPGGGWLIPPGECPWKWSAREDAGEAQPQGWAAP